MDKPSILTHYLYMIKKEIIRNSYTDLCYSWGFTKEEVEECESYIAEHLGEDFMFTSIK